MLDSCSSSSDTTLRLHSIDFRELVMLLSRFFFFPFFNVRGSLNSWKLTSKGENLKSRHVQSRCGTSEIKHGTVAVEGLRETVVQSNPLFTRF